MVNAGCRARRRSARRISSHHDTSPFRAGTVGEDALVNVAESGADLVDVAELGAGLASWLRLALGRSAMRSAVRSSR